MKNKMDGVRRQIANDVEDTKDGRRIVFGTSDQKFISM